MNRLHGTLLAIDSAGSVMLIDVEAGGRQYTATLIGAGDDMSDWHSGMQVSLLFKETEVSLGKGLSGLLSMRNRLPGRITAIERGRLLTRVALQLEMGTINAVITTRSCDALQLALGDEAEGLVKANEMSVAPRERQS
jgi:molybdate transport system regulatory protein